MADIFQPTDKLKSLYQGLSQNDGLKTPYEQFEKDMMDTAKLRQIHTFLSNKPGFEVPWDDFQSQLFSQNGKEDKEEVKIPQERFQQPPQMPQDTFSPTIPEPEMGDLKPISNVPLPEDLDTSKIPVVKDNLRTEYRTPNPLRDAVDYMETQRKDFVGSLYNGLRELGANIAVGGIELPELMGSLTGANLLKSGIGKVIPAYGRFTEREKEQKEKIKSDIYEWGQANHIEVGESMGSFVGGMLPFIGMVVASTYMPALAPYTTGAFAAMGAGEGYGAIKRTEENRLNEAINAVVAQEGGITKERIAELQQEVGLNGLAKAAAPIGYSLVYSIPMTKYMSKMINPALYRKAARQLFKIPEVNNAAMKTGIEILEKWAQKDKAAAMNYIKQMARGSAHSIATMESIHLGKTAVDKAILGENPEDFWNQVGHSALSGLFFGMVTTPFGIATQNRANQRRREAQGVVKLTLDAKNRPVEILPGEVEGKRKGVTPDGRIVDVTKEMNNRGVEISTKIFNEQVNQFKQTGEFSPYIVPKEAVSRYEMFINRFSKDGKVKYNTTEHGHRIVILEETTPEGAREKHFDVINIDNGRIVNVPESSIKQGGEINTSELINNFSKNVHELYNREQERQGKIGTESAPESPQPPRQPIPRQPSPREQYETQVRNETAPFVNENGNIVVYKDAITESGEPVFLIKGDPESGEGFFIRTASGEEQFITDKSRLTGERTELTVDQFIQDKLTEWDEAQQARQTVEDNTVDIDGQKFVVIGEQDNEMILQPIDEQQNPIGDVKFVSKEQLAQEAGEEAARQEIAATEQAKEQGRLITINETDYPVETQEDGSFIVSLPENGDPAVFESDIRSTLPGEQQNRIELLTEDVIVPPAVPWGQGTTQKVTVGIRILPEGQKTVPQEAISPAGETATPKVEATLPGEVISPELPLNQPTYTQNKKETTRENILSLVDESINELDASKLDGIRVDNDPELSKALTEAVNSINETNETAQNLLNSFDKAKTSNEYTKLADQFRALPDNVQAKFNKEFKSKDAVLKKLVKKEGEREWIRQQEEREYVPFEESGDSFNQWASLHATNPHDIHEAYQNELANAPYNLLQGWQLDLLGEKFTSKSFKRYADPNWLSQGLARAWLGGEKRRTIDQFTAAWEMESGEVIDPQQVVDFMMQYPTKNVRKTTDLSQELARRYRYITGESIKNYSSARKLPPAEKLFDKFITDNKLENDYFTSEDALKLLETHRDKLSTEEYETIKKHLENEITESEQAASFWGEEEPVSPLGETTERERHGVQDEAEAEERLLQSPGLDRGTETREQSLTDVFGQAETQEEIRVRKLNEKLKGLTEAQKQLAKIEIDKAKKTAKAQGDLFSGEQETSYLKRAIGENANLKRKVKRNLERAKRMHNQGFDPLIIKYETGWEQGVDKMWRYEVADDYERFDEAFKKIDNRGIFADTNMTFYELIGDDPLFDDYPRLKDMKFTKLSPFLDVFGSIQGWYNEETNTLNITPYVQDKRATLIHEVQHAIQAIENWARGGNEQVAALSLPVEKIKEIAEKVKEKLRENIIKMDAEIKEARNLIKYFKENPEKKDLLQKYSIEHEELFEIQMKRYNELKQKDENINPFIEDDIVKEISNQKLKAFKNITNIIKDATGNKPTNYKIIFKIKEKKTFEAGFSSIIAENIKKKSEINDKIRAIDQAKTKQEIFESVKDNAGSAFYNAYRAIAGEEEARAMSKRDNLTPRERKESLISSSFDVAPEEQIVIFGKQGESKSALPTETITLTNGIKLTPDTYRDNPIVRIDNIGDNLTKLVRAGAVQSPEGTLFIPAGKFNESLRKMQELMNVSIQETPTEAPKSTVDTETTRIKENAIKDGTFMKAPNGKATNLNENQWLQVRTDNFKKWFGDWINDPENASKVIDSNGEPLVVYHGTNKKFNVFRLKKIDYTKYEEYEPGDEKLNYTEGVYFSKNKSTALRYFDPYDKNSTLYSVFLNIKSPKYEKTNVIGISNVKELIKDGYDGIIATGGDIFYSPMNEIVATSPNQIKSATDNIGEFSPESDDIRFRTTGLKTIKINGKDVRIRLLPEGTQVVDGFYSPLERSVRELKSNKWGTGQQALNELKKAGLKADEIQWTGIGEWLREQKNVSKEQILDYLKENRVELVEVVKEAKDEGLVDTENPLPHIQERLDELNEALEDKERWERQIEEAYSEWYKIDLREREEQLNKKLEEWEDNYGSEDNVRSEIEQIYQDPDNFKPLIEGDTKFSDYQLPGEKENYREVLVTLPSKMRYNESDLRYGNKLTKTINGNYVILGEDGTKVDGTIISSSKDEVLSSYFKTSPTTFKSTHFDEPNIVGHLRMSDRIDADGNKVLHIDEAQSDWAQSGREKGFVSKIDRNNIANVREDENVWVVRFDDGSFLDISKKDAKNEEEAKTLALQSQKERFQSRDGKVLTAPFVTSTSAWTKLMAKYAIREAVKSGLDKITWTSGETQNDRYDLSKQVNSIYASEYSDRWDNKTRKYDKVKEVEINVKGENDPIRLIVDDKGNVIDGHDKFTEHNLTDIVGKEVAEKILSQEQEHEFDTDDLKVGGSGMKGFYGSPTESKTGIIGKAFQQAVRDITGERNVRIGETEIDTGDGETVIQHSIEITPEIIANTQQGMPLFKNSFSGIEKGTVSDKVISNEIKSVFDILNANAVNAGAIHVVQTPEQLPPKFAKDAVRLKNTQGFYLPTTGETYFITDNISSPKEALKTWVHEVTGHKGLRNLIPEHLLTPLLEKFYDDLGGAEVIDSSLPSSYRNASKAEKMEEYITFLAEDIINERDLTPQKKSFWKKILDGIMNLLNKLFDKKVKFTHADVEELIRASVQSVYQKEKESERFKDRATQETMPKYFDEVLASIKRGELRERKSGDMLKSEKNAQKYFEVNPDRLRHTLSVFNRPEFRAYRDKNIRPNELQGLLNLSGVKAIEKELIRDVVRSNYPKTKLIPYNELEAVVRANIIPLERIESTSYADYGADAIQGDFDNAYTLIFNFPEVEHGKEGHFSYQFTPDKTRKIDYVPKQLDENTWVAVEDGYMEQGADESNIMRFVGTAANSREKVEKWINDYEERFAEGIKDVNRGMYGHIRIWERGNDVIMAEVQSDFFQKFGARTLFIENEIKNNPELQKEQDKINDSFKEKIIDFLKNSKDYEIDNASVNFKGKELFGLIEIKDLITNYGLIPNRAKEEHAELLKQIEKAKKELQKELARFENKVYSMLSPAEKQFIASAKVWEKRLLHEAIAEAMDKGADRFLIPTPHTLATIEGYIGGAAPPYEVISDRNAYSNGNLGDGDIIEMGGEEYVVIESDPYNEYMRIAPAKDMDRWKIREALQDDVDFKYDELAYEYSGKLSIDDINEIGDTFYVSEVKEILLEGLNSKAEEKGESIEDVFIELDDFQEEIEEAIRSEESEKYRFDENVKEYFEDELGYSKAIKVGDEIFIWKSEPHYEIISQPGQNRVNIDDFNIEDLAESEQRVLKKYEEYGEQLKEEFGDNVSNEVDENGYGWVAVDLSGVETGRPVVAYRTKHENPHLWKNWTREGEKYVSAQGKEWNVPDTGTLKHEVYQKLMENIDNHRTKAFEPEIFDYWFNKHRKNLKGNLGAVGNTTTVAAQMYDMMPQRYSYKPEPNLKTRLSFPENGWLEVDRDVFMHRDGQVWEAPVEGTIANDIYKQVIDNITKSERNFDPAIFNVLMNAFENSISQYELFRGRSIYYSLAKKIADTISDAMPKDETIRYRTKGNSAKNVAQEATKPEKPMFLDQMAQAEHDAKVAEEMYTKAKREKPNWHEEQRRMREFWIDQNLPIEGWEADILNNGGKMNEYSKPYRDMRNSFGRIEYLYNKFQKEFMLPFPKILADVVKQGISQELAVSYMIARSGLKRNEVMRSEELESWADKRLELLKKKHPDKKITLENVKNSKEYKAKHKELSNTDFASLTGFREEGDPRHPDEVARSIVFWVESKLTPETTERIWEHWNKTAQGIRDIWLEGGEITKEQYNFLNKRMPDYVPMRGWRHGKSEEIIYHKEGGKGKSYMKAKGRVSLPDNPIAVIQTMGFKAISEQVSNEVNTAALNLMVNNYGEKFKDMHRFKKAYFVQEIIRDADGNPEKVWTLYREPVTRPDGSTDYEIATPPESMFDSGEARQFISREHEQLRTVYNAKEHEVIVKKAGVPYVMIFDEKYTTVAQALNHNNTMFRFLGREWDARKIGDNPIIDGMATVTNFMKGMMTTHSPVFPITNAPRDQQNVAITQYIKNNSRIGKANKYTTPEGASSIWRFLDEGKEFVPRNETDRLLIAFYENGGAVGFTRDKSVKQIEKELKRQLKYAFRKGTIKQSTIDAARFLFDRIARYNTVIEDLTRFSVFQYGVKDLGLSYKDAAFESRTSSDDFNMRGKGTKIFETWWAFFKASINELDKDVRLAKYNPGRAFTSAAMMVLWGYIEALFNDTADGDKDDYFSINPYVRQNYMVIKTGKKYFRMPISQFWRGFHAMGVNIYDAAWGHITPGQAAGRTIASLIGGMSPVDLTELFSDGKLTLGALVPTSIKPIYEVKVNRDFMDNTIYHEKFTLKMQEEARNSNLHKKNVNVAAKFMTDMLWKLGGGDDGDNRIIVDKDGELKYVPRVFDVNPAWIEHLFRGYTGGVGRFLTDLTKFVYELVAPNEAISINNTPFLNSFLRNTPDDKWKYIREWQNVMKYAQMWKAEDTEAYRGAKSEDSTGEDFDYAYSLKNMKNNEIYQTFMAYNRNIERIVKAKGLQDEDAAHEITDLMKEGIERINEIKKQHKK